MRLAWTDWLIPTPNRSCLLFQRLLFRSPLGRTIPPTQAFITVGAPLCSAHATCSACDSHAVPVSSPFWASLCHPQDSHAGPSKHTIFCKSEYPRLLLASISTEGKGIKTRRQQCRGNIGGPSFHTLVTLPRKRTCLNVALEGESFGVRSGKEAVSMPFSPPCPPHRLQRRALGLPLFLVPAILRAQGQSSRSCLRSPSFSPPCPVSPSWMTAWGHRWPWLSLMVNISVADPALQEEGTSLHLWDPASSKSIGYLGFRLWFITLKALCPRFSRQGLLGIMKLLILFPNWLLGFALNYLKIRVSGMWWTGSFSSFV